MRFVNLYYSAGSTALKCGADKFNTAKEAAAAASDNGNYYMTIPYVSKRERAGDGQSVQRSVPLTVELFNQHVVNGRGRVELHGDTLDEITYFPMTETFVFRKITGSLAALTHAEMEAARIVL